MSGSGEWVVSEWWVVVVVEWWVVVVVSGGCGW